MAGGTMDLKKEGITGVEAPPMELGENLEAETEAAPIPSGEHLPSFRQHPDPPCDDLRPIATYADAAPELCDPGAAPAHHGLDPGGETERPQAPQEAGPQENAEAGHRHPGDVLEETPQPAQPECSSSWAPGPLMELETDGEVGKGHNDLPEEEEAAVAAAEDDRIQLESLLARLKRMSPTFRDPLPCPEDGLLPASDGEESGPLLKPGDCAPCPLHIATGRGLGVSGAHQHCGRRTRGLLSAETDSEDLLGLLQYEGGDPSEAPDPPLLACSDGMAGSGYQKVYRQAAGQEGPPGPEPPGQGRAGSCPQKVGEAASPKEGTPLDIPSWEDSPKTELDLPSASDGPNKTQPDSFSALKDVPGPCDPEDLLDGVIFGAKYLGSTQLLSERNPPSSVRMAQAQEAVDTVKAPEGESQPMTEVDLFISTQRIKVLNADSQEAMMDHPLQTISYIADIGSIVVLMARRKLPHRADAAAEKRIYRMICHVFHSADAPLIARAIGQAFSVAYQHFLHSSGIDPGQVCPRRCADGDMEEIRLPTGEEMYNGDLAHFSKQENCKEVIIPKQKGEILGVVIVESGWGSILPTVVIANLMHRGAAERSGKLSIGDRIMSINGTSLVGLPLATCQNIIRDLKSHTEVTLNVVHCPPVTTAIVRRPDTKYPLGFCVENGIICSLMRGGIAERGGIRVGHRIIEINGQSVVAMPHEKIIQILQQAVSEVRIKTMPASTYRLLTGQEQPVFL